MTHDLHRAGARHVLHLLYLRSCKAQALRTGGGLTLKDEGAVGDARTDQKNQPTACRSVPKVSCPTEFGIRNLTSVVNS